MNNVKVTVGLYRHFKGQYYYVTGLSKSAEDEVTIMVNYFNVCHPEYGSFVRPLDDFIATSDVGVDMNLDYYEDKICDRKDNVTGQFARFERVKDLNFQLGSVSTEQLINELRTRTDSPIHELDIEGLQSNVFAKDYCVGEAYNETEDTPRGVYTLATFETQKKAENYLDTHSHKKNTKVFKRTFIEV